MGVSSITLTNASKQFNGKVVFEKLNLSLSVGDAVAVTGANGSGKSTLIKIISGYTPLSSGTIKWMTTDGPIDGSVIYKDCALAAPYLDLFDDFTLSENIRIFGDLKGFRNHMSAQNVIGFMELEHAANKKLKDFSSGMKQRTKLAMAICSNTSILLLDEPLSNLDSKGYEWYKKHTNGNMQDRIVLVGSNMEGTETHFCNKRIHLG